MTFSPDFVPPKENLSSVPRRTSSVYAEYVERVQRNLAIFSILDEGVEESFQSDLSLSDSAPKYPIFEFLVNDRTEETISRKFELHISDKLRFSVEQGSEMLTSALRRLCMNAEILKVDWQSAWITQQSSEEQDIWISLAEEVLQLHQMYDEKSKHCGDIKLLENEFSDAELNYIEKTLNRLLERYEQEYLPTCFSASALVYEAWKLGRFSHDSSFKDLIDGLFIESDEPTTNLLQEMSNGLGTRVKKIDEDLLSNGKKWIRSLHPDEQKWFACVEQSLIHKTVVHKDKKTKKRYLIHYPLIIDDYWFSGLAYFYAEFNSASSGQLPEIFNRQKYFKIYRLIQTITDALKVARKQVALSTATSIFQHGGSVEESFREAVREYFVCLHIFDESDLYALEKNNVRVRNQLVYQGHKVKIYAPKWISDDYRKLLQKEIDGHKQISGFDIPGLYEEVEKVCNDLRTIQLESEKKGREEGKEEQSRQIAHQAAGLVAEVWGDPKRNQLAPQTLACLWHLRSLIDIWGNFDLLPNEVISDSSDPVFAELIGSGDREILDRFIDIGLSHALRRATYRRTDSTSEDKEVRNQALQILRSTNSVEEFRKRIGIEIDTSEFPNWIGYRGFALCFHHCFWQAAYHAFRAACGYQNNSPKPNCLYIQVTPGQVRIANRVVSEKNLSQLRRDRQFYEILQGRMNKLFLIDGPHLVDESHIIEQVVEESAKLFQVMISIGEHQ
jgi:hypothetical protein